MSDETRKEKLKVIYVEPGKRASVIEIEDSLKAMQSLVGGTIEEYMPYEDDVAIICNDEGKMIGLPYNREIRGEDGRQLDIIAGNFFVCYAPVESEKFLSMPPHLEEKYREKFDYPEQFFRTEEGIRSMKYDPGHGSRDQEISR